MGTKTRKATRPPRVSAPASTVTKSQVEPLLMKAAKEAMLPGQRLIVVSTTEVRLINTQD